MRGGEGRTGLGRLAEAGEEVEVGLDLRGGSEVGGGVVAGGGGHGGAAGGIGEEAGEGGGEAGGGVGRGGGDKLAGEAGGEGFSDALSVVGDGGEAVGLGLDEEVGEGFALRGEHSKISGVVERGGVAVEAEEFYPGGVGVGAGESLGGGEGGAVAGEPELPVERGGEVGDDGEEGALVFLGAKHGHVEKHGGGGRGTVLGAEGFAGGSARGGRGGRYGEDEGVMDNGEVIGREGEILDKVVASGVAVGDDVGGGA